MVPEYEHGGKSCCHNLPVRISKVEISKLRQYLMLSCTVKFVTWLYFEILVSVTLY